MDTLLKAGRIIFSIGIIALGILCFISQDFIVGRPPATTLAPNLPGKLLWAYVSGGILILCGLAVITHIKARLASLIVACTYPGILIFTSASL